ncbi:hypothetical protein AB5I41_24130 [Sphingomonas sp. MMS24-JH45]
MMPPTSSMPTPSTAPGRRRRSASPAACAPPRLRPARLSAERPRHRGRTRTSPHVVLSRRVTPFTPAPPAPTSTPCRWRRPRFQDADDRRHRAARRTHCPGGALAPPGRLAATARCASRATSAWFSPELATGQRRDGEGVRRPAPHDGGYVLVAPG